MTYRTNAKERAVIPDCKVCGQHLDAETADLCFDCWMDLEDDAREGATPRHFSSEEP